MFNKTRVEHTTRACLVSPKDVAVDKKEAHTRQLAVGGIETNLRECYTPKCNRGCVLTIAPSLLLFALAAVFNL